MPMTTAADGCKIHYERSGSGPTVALIPGLGGDGRFWSGVVSCLADRFDLIVMDHRGAGRSDRPDKPYSIGIIADDLLTVLNAEQVEATHLVGHSTGGAIVQTLALDAPARARRLVISGSWDRPDARFRALFEARAALLDAGLSGPYQLLTHVFGFDPAWMESHEAELNRAVDVAGETLAPLSVTAARVRMLLDFDRSAELARVRHETLVIGAAGDVLIPFHHAERLAARLTGAELVRLEGGHFHPSIDPIPFADAVASFLQRAA